MLGKMAALKVDANERVWAAAEKRAEILREFDRSGASGVEFARIIGVKYPTFAGWIRRRGARTAGARRRGRPKKEPVRFVEATTPGSPTEPVMVELPRGVPVQVSSAGQIPLVHELLGSLESD